MLLPRIVSLRWIFNRFDKLTAKWTVPSAASFYVPTLPGLVQDEENPLRMFAGHIPSDPDAAILPSTTVYAHTFFLMIKARRRADKERIMFWFNVRHAALPGSFCR